MTPAANPTPEAQTSDDTALDSRYEAAKASIHAKARAREAAGHAVMAGAMAFGTAAHGGPLARVVRAAEVVCICFAFIAPVLLFWVYA